MKTILLQTITALVLFTACKKESYILKETKSQLISIDNDLALDTEIDSLIIPFRTHLNKTLDSTLAYAPETYSKKNGELNTAIGNFMADVVYELGNPVFKSRTGLNIDGVLLNHGGIRSVISNGDISARTAFEVMPFENSVVVAALNKTDMLDLVNYLVNQQKAHPIANMELIVNNLNALKSFKINSKALEDKTYYIATSDYLANGGDRMNFFKQADTIYNTDYKIRNMLIDYFTKTDTITPKIDNRFIKLN